jgi:hypothetical protein
MAVEYTNPSIKSDGHVLLTGPITGTVTLDDGTVVDVTQPVIAVSDETAEEIARKIGERYAAEGHPDDVEEDEDGNLVQRPFEYVAPEDVPADTTKKD